MTACGNPSCKIGEIVQGQYGAEGDEPFRERLASGYCSKRCKRHAGPVKKERGKPTLTLLSANHGPGEGKAQPKETPWRSKPYRDFIKSLPCCVPKCGREGVDPHHEQEKAKGGMATTPGDDRCVPLCREHHDMRQHGPLGRKIWAAWGVMNIERVILALNEEFMRQGHKIKE